MRKGSVLKMNKQANCVKRLGIAWSGRSIRNLEKDSVSGMKNHEVSRHVRSTMNSTCNE